jgi:hypothetical protein
MFKISVNVVGNFSQKTKQNQSKVTWQNNTVRILAIGNLKEKK